MYSLIMTGWFKQVTLTRMLSRCVLPVALFVGQNVLTLWINLTVPGQNTDVA